MGSDAELENLLDDLYLSNIEDAAADRLPSALAAFIGGGSSALWSFDPASGAPRGNMLSTFPAEVTVRYEMHYHRLDPWLGPIVGQRLGQAVFGSEFIDDRDLARGAFYNEFAQQLGTFHLLAVVSPLDRRAGSPLVALSLHRAEKFEPFNAVAAQRLNLVMPHVRRTMQLRELTPASNGCNGGVDDRGSA